MGNLFCLFGFSQFAAVARDFCPFPEYNPSPLLNILSADSSLLLSEHYAAVQASLTPQQQQDFTQSLRSTFGREGKVSNGGVGIVALSLAILFDTLAREVKEEYVSDQEPIPGLFLKDPTGTYPPPVYIISKYLRLVPHIANNPTRMRDETEKYFHELENAAVLVVDSVYTAQKYDDITGQNLARCYVIGKSLLLHLQRLSNRTVAEKDFMAKKNNRSDPEPVLNLNCDPSVASERLQSAVGSFDEDAKDAFEQCAVSNEIRDQDERRFENIERIVMSQWLVTALLTLNKIEPGGRQKNLAQTDDFDLKANSLGRWS